jgi:hypothetical protein
MNETVRSLVAGAAGAVVAISVVVGQPALANEVDKVKAQKVTSAMIKNGTIQPKDLNAQVKASLAKADSALQSVPDNSVTGAKVVNGSLNSSDLAVASGSISLNAPPLTPGQCSSSGGIPTGQDVTGDAVLTNEPGNVAGSIYIYARQDPGTPTAIDIVICSIGTTFDPPAATYTWMVINNG